MKNRHINSAFGLILAFLALAGVVLADVLPNEDSKNEVFRQLINDMVTIPGKNYAMGKFEVSQKQWSAVMDNNPSSFKDPDHPVESVSWNDCQSFLTRLNAIPAIRESGMTFRLPTEAEWEFACRAGATGQFCKLADGTEITANTLLTVAWFRKDGVQHHQCVGWKKANAFGLYDMHGNVWEWTSTWMATADGGKRVYRGGAWYDSAYECGASFQYCAKPSDRAGSMGFRLCANVPGN